MRDVTTLVLLFFGVLIPASRPNTGLRVIGGRDATPGEYPFATRIEKHLKLIYSNKNINKIYSSCTGAAISPTWTLTAAHCEPDHLYLTKNMTKFVVEYRSMIRYGDPHTKPSENAKASAVLKVISMGFKRPRGVGLRNDIALFFTEPILLETYAKVSAVDYTSLYGREVTLMGFGMMKASPSIYDINTTLNLDKPLQVMDAMLRSCDPYKINRMTMSVLCAVPACGKFQMVYKGDSGGPVVHARGLVGVISAGRRFWEDVKEGQRRMFNPQNVVIAPVSPYLDWIYKHINT